MDKLRIIVIAAHPLVRKGIEAIVAEEFPGASLMSLGGIPEARLEAELLVYDSESGNGRTLEDLAGTIPKMPVLVFNLPAEERGVGNCEISESSASLTKDANVRSFIDAMHLLIDKLPPLPHPIFEPDGLTARLSRRELEIFRILGQEIPVRIVARRLGISVKTVEAHRESIKNKLGLHTAREVVAAALALLASQESNNR